ncbi:MAG: hypothetical protein E7240_02740 [Lachnospiraceae bacterium]|nr:hypothetical protein [Lachnospiraceae bacterium]
MKNNQVPAIEKREKNQNNASKTSLISKQSAIQIVEQKKTKEKILERKKYLEALAEEMKVRIEKAPEGSLCINKRGTRTNPEYYHRKDPSMRNGVYLRKKDIALAKALAQKDYDIKVLKSADKELKAIEAFLQGIPDRTAEEVFFSLSEPRKDLVNPILETDEEFADRWQNIKYIGKEFAEDIPEMFTDKGERVRSKSEMLIANTFARRGIPYHYEYPLKLAGFGVVHPDFTVLSVRERKIYFWEHLGRMDDAGYVNRNLRKLISYIKNGIYPGEQLILTAETSTAPIDMRIVQKMIKRYLE